MSSPSNNIAPRLNPQQQKITKIVTSKEWVLPPRPKPGRKPSIDTPSTKRKAQNRALQRLFRERRANRVSELEDKILEIEKERSIKEGLMNNHIKNLSMENKRLHKVIEDLKRQIVTPSATTVSAKPSPMTVEDVQKTAKYISPISSAATSPNNTNGGSIPDDCGVCLKDDCLCESIGIKEVSIENFKPMAAVPLKKRKRKDDEENELDFTNKFKFKKMPDLNKLNNKVIQNQGDLFVAAGQQQQQQQQPSSSSLPLRLIEEEENCGFCSDDTPCVCRELAKEVEKLNKMNDLLNKEMIETSLPPLKNIARQNSLPVLHPGPSVEFNKSTKTDNSTTITRSSSLTSIPIVKTSTSECTGNPGTCSQCQTDPMSTLFCTSILNKDGEEEEEDKKHDDVFISTADAYKTLSRHENFNMINFNTLIGKLTTRGMLVEVGSVASVLRELDRKFSCSQ